MTADTKATERPWSFDELGGSKPDGLGYIYGPGGHRYIDEITHHGVAHRSREENLANAELIVRAVNSYDPALQDKLTKAVKALEQCATPFTLPNIDDLSGDALEKSVAIFRCLVEHALAVQTAANTVLRSIKESE